MTTDMSTDLVFIVKCLRRYIQARYGYTAAVVVGSALPYLTVRVRSLDEPRLGTQ